MMMLPGWRNFRTPYSPKKVRALVSTIRGSMSELCGGMRVEDLYWQAKSMGFDFDREPRTEN